MSYLLVSLKHLQSFIFFFLIIITLRMKLKILSKGYKKLHDLPLACSPSFISYFLPTYSLVAPKSEKAMAPHSSTLAWKIPWMEEPGGLQSMGSRRVGHDWATSLSLFNFTHCRRKWQPTPVFLPRESQGQRSLVGCCLWGHTGSNTVTKKDTT